jgi:hypothetical protein
MSRDRNTYAKRQRESGKKLKAAEKRQRRQKRKDAAANGTDAPGQIQPDAQQELSDLPGV